MNVLEPMLLWVPIAVVILLIWWIAKHRKETTGALKKASNLVSKKEDGHSSRPAEFDHKDHHAGGHDKNHQDKPLWKRALSLLVTLAIIVLVLLAIAWLAKQLGFGQIPGSSPEASRAPMPVAVTLGKQYVTAPSNTRDWSESDWVDVPDGYNVRAYPSMSLGEYEVQCLDHGGNAHRWSLATCGELDMVRFRSTDGEPFAMSYEFLPK